MKVGFEKLGRPPQFNLRGSDTMDIRQRYVIAALMVLLTYTWSVTGGTGAGAIASDAHFRLLDKVVVTANGNDIMTFSGQFLRLYNLMFLGEELKQTPPTLLTAAASQANRKAWYYIPFIMGHSLDPDQYGLPANAVKEPTITFYFADGRRMAIGPDATSIDISSAKIDVYERPYIDSSVPAGGFLPLLIKQQKVDVVQDGEKEVTLSHLVQGHFVRALFIEAYKGGSGNNDFVYADDVVKSARLTVDGSPKFEKSDWEAVQQINKSHYALDDLETGLIVLDAAGDDKKTNPWPNQQGVSQLWPVRHPKESPILTLDLAKRAGDCKVIVTSIHTALV